MDKKKIKGRNTKRALASSGKEKYKGKEYHILRGKRLQNPKEYRGIKEYSTI